MSFSRSLGGNGRSAADSLAALCADQKAIDERYNASAGVVEGHQRQIAAIKEQLTPVLEAAPDSAAVSGSVWGHAGDDQSGSYGFSVSISLADSTTAVKSAP